MITWFLTLLVPFSPLVPLRQKAFQTVDYIMEVLEARLAVSGTDLDVDLKNLVQDLCQALIKLAAEVRHMGASLEHCLRALLRLQQILPGCRHLLVSAPALVALLEGAVSTVK